MATMSSPSVARDVMSHSAMSRSRATSSVGASTRFASPGRTRSAGLTRRQRQHVHRRQVSRTGVAAGSNQDGAASTAMRTTAADTDEEYDVIVIGSGIGGLSAASLLAKYGYSVKVFESHYLAGGCCHMFDHRDKDGGLWQFEVGPSIWEGLDRPTGNPLRMVFDALGEEMPVETYDGISMWTEEGHWRFQLGDDEAPGGFCDLLREKSTNPELAIKEWKALKNRF